MNLPQPFIDYFDSKFMAVYVVTSYWERYTQLGGSFNGNS